jgi:hypothetical protein
MVGFSTAGQNIGTQFGMPLFGVAGNLPPFTGNYFWVDGTNGSDGNTGGPQDPFKTLTQAQSACLAGNNDVVFFTGTFTPTATFVWSKNNTHLIGLSVTNFGLASISVASTAATSGAFSPLVSVTASGCIFQNISALSGIAQAATQVTWAESGGSNTYIGCNFSQVGNATAAAQAGCRAFTMASKSNSFTQCVIGGDAVVRATGTNFNMEMLAGAGSSIFTGCLFPMWSSVAASAYVNAATATCTGTMIFDDCQFVNAMGNAGAVLPAVGLTINATAGAAFLLTPLTVAMATSVATTGQLTYISSAVSTSGGNRASTAT